MHFQITPLQAEAFEPLFTLTDAELAARNACRQQVTERPGTPCRVSLEDARIGETVILLNHMHLPGTTPFRASHAIFVRQGARTAKLAVGEVPDVIRSRLISLRFFDRADMMIHADVVAGECVADATAAAFATPDIAYGHLHYAKPGCFAASVHPVT
ncbi:DUF1203 domain-containing protein [Dinoroseobacter sp. S124A]|uniref:DUF1203 domain-containing protein n=1 Tax=Dinoroseobacter sp. S124A TaxID=3415128 RepID=UPI003C7D30E4